MQKIVFSLILIATLFLGIANAGPEFSNPEKPYWDDVNVEQFARTELAESKCECDWFRTLAYYNAQIVTFYHSKNGWITDVQQVIEYDDGYIELISVNGLGGNYIINPGTDPIAVWERTGTRQTGKQIALTQAETTMIWNTMKLVESVIKR